MSFYIFRSSDYIVNLNLLLGLLDLCSSKSRFSFKREYSRSNENNTITGIQLRLFYFKRGRSWDHLLVKMFLETQIYYIL